MDDFRRTAIDGGYLDKGTREPGLVNVLSNR